jgi:hypothetical protein
MMDPAMRAAGRLPAPKLIVPLVGEAEAWVETVEMDEPVADAVDDPEAWDEVS